VEAHGDMNFYLREISPFFPGNFNLGFLARIECLSEDFLLASKPCTVLESPQLTSNKQTIARRLPWIHCLMADYNCCLHILTFLCMSFEVPPANDNPFRSAQNEGRSYYFAIRRRTVKSRTEGLHVTW
jgi:hypothetical protein